MPKQNGNPKILAAGAAVQLLTGIPAAWGVFQKPVMAQYGFSRGQAMLSFAILVAGYGIGCAIGGFVQDQHGPRYAALWGTALLGGGSMGAALVPQGNAALFFLVYSIPAGVGSAFLAPAVLACAQKWYASRKGVATGGQRCGYGAFRCVFNRFCGFVETAGGCVYVCRARCGGAGGVRGIRRRAAKSTPARRPAKRKSGKRPAAPPDGAHHTVPPVCCGGGAGSPAHAAVQPGDSDHCSGPRPAGAVGALCVAVGSAASAAGRLLCPAASDHWGRKPVLYGVYAALAAGSIGFAFAQGWWVLAAYCVLTCFYSGGAAVQPALNTDCSALPCGGQLWLDRPWHERRQPAELCGQPAAGSACPAYAGGSQRRGGRDMFPICKTCSNG